MRAATSSPAGATSSCGASPPRDGRIIGTRGYHAGEELHVVRREDGSVSHLDVGTFILTREPYEPGAPIPGGHPPLG